MKSWMFLMLVLFISGLLKFSVLSFCTTNFTITLFVMLLSVLRGTSRTSKRFPFFNRYVLGQASKRSYTDGFGLNWALLIESSLQRHRLRVGDGRQHVQGLRHSRVHQQALLHLSHDHAHHVVELLGCGWSLVRFVGRSQAARHQYGAGHNDVLLASVIHV